VKRVTWRIQLRITGGDSAYHLSVDGSTHSALCGERTVPTELKLAEWESDTAEQWCLKCKRISNSTAQLRAATDRLEMREAK
jgi:hypothetical protein